MRAARQFVSPAGARWPACRCGASARRAVWLAGRHRQGPRQRHGGDAGPAQAKPRPDRPDHAPAIHLDAIRASGQLNLLGQRPIAFIEREHLILRKRKKPALSTPNAMRCKASDASGALLDARTYYSVGGGFVVDDSALSSGFVPQPAATAPPVCQRARTAGAVPRASATDQPDHAGQRTGLARRSQRARGLLNLWGGDARPACARLPARSVLPGGMHVRRRAAELYRAVRHARSRAATADGDGLGEFVCAGGQRRKRRWRPRGHPPPPAAAGIIPAVLHYYTRFVPGANADGVVRFLLTAGAIGILFKLNASISGAEVGCQGEVGSGLLDGCRRWPKCWAARRNKWKTPPKSAWNTIWA